MGFSGFPLTRVFAGQALIPTPFDRNFGYCEKPNPGEIEILKIPPILQILILTKGAQSPIP